MSSALLISDAAKRVKVEAHVLRYWEEELGLPIKRNELGHRYYTEEDVKRFQEIKDLKERGLQLKAIRMVLKNGKLDMIMPAAPLDAEEEKSQKSAEIIKEFPSMKQTELFREAKKAESENSAKREETGGRQQEREQPERRQQEREQQERRQQEREQPERRQQEREQQEIGQQEREKRESGQEEREQQEREQRESRQQEREQRESRQQERGQQEKRQGQQERGRIQVVRGGRMGQEEPAGTSELTRVTGEAEVVKDMPTAEKRQDKPLPAEQRQSLQRESNEEKLKRLQWLLKQLFKETLQENNEYLCREMKESVLKEMDYQFRMQEEREEERNTEKVKREEEHYKKIDDLLRKKRRLLKK